MSPSNRKRRLFYLQREVGPAVDVYDGAAPNLSARDCTKLHPSNAFGHIAEARNVWFSVQLI